MNIFNKIIEKLYFMQKDNLALYCQYTKAYNRNWWIKVAKKKLDKKDCYITVIDIDDLKKYNDSNGHVAGNLLIKTIASTLMKAFEKKSYLCRYGGDEFILVTFVDPTEKLEILASNFSFGIYHKTAEEAIRESFVKADELLYEMKKRKKGTL